MIGTWNAPLGEDKTSEELLVSFDGQRDRRILIIPALFDEANKMRRFTLQTMRALDQLGVDSFLPDFPGQNESLVALKDQSLAGWKRAAAAAAQEFEATEVLTMRAGALVAPDGLPAHTYAAQTGPRQLRAMLRARTIAMREEGVDESTDVLTRRGRGEGLVLAGWEIGPTMFRELEEADSAPGGTIIDQKSLGGRGLWLRAEPDEDAEQAALLAAAIAGPQEAEA